MTRATDKERARLLDRLDRASAFLDSRYRIPLTNIRLGWDPIGGLVPLAGDIVTTAASLWLVNEARRLGAPAGTIGRMVVNVAVDSIFGLVPIAGTIFDVFFRANERNLRLVLQHIENELAASKAAKRPPKRQG